MPEVRPARVSVPTTDGDLPAYLWLPEGGEAPAPGLVMVQEIFGVSDYVQARCADLAGLGYAVLAPELYWRVGQTTVDESQEDFLQQAMGLAGQLDWAAAVNDTATCLAYLAARPEVDPVGIFGFCFGGGLAFDVAARTDPAVLVSYYGSALPGLTALAPQVTCPSLHHFGTADLYLPMDQVERIRDAVTAGGTRHDVEVELHEGAGHAFDNPHPMFHHEEASTKAWQQTAAFLGRYLPVRAR